MEDLNPQREHMADESMVRNLAAQAEAIWPQEAPLFGRYPLPEAPEILDAGCGTGEITVRLAELFPRARIVGVDVLDEHLARARRRAAPYGARVRFENQSVFELGYPDGAFDLVVCRHLLQAVPQTERVLAELLRVARRGGTLHLIAEDYGMMQFEPRRLDPDEFWHRGPVAFGAATGTDLRIGRKAYGKLRRLGVRDITIDYVIVDPLRVPRATFAAIWEAWRDGYAASVAQFLNIPEAEIVAHFDDMIATLRDPDGYGVWFVPVVAARVPSS
jgi:SAM-dependent methyltransferase